MLPPHLAEEINCPNYEPFSFEWEMDCGEGLKWLSRSVVYISNNRSLGGILLGNFMGALGPPRSSQWPITRYILPVETFHNREHEREVIREI